MCIICRMNDFKKLISSLKANFWPWIAAPLLSYVILSVFVPVHWQAFSPLLSPKWGLALVIVLVSLAWREVLLPRLQAWRENRAKEMREMQRLHAIEMAKWRKEATRLCRNCNTQYRDQEPAGGRFMCQQCGHVSRRPLLEIPGARPVSCDKGQKQQFSGPQDEDQRLARICGWLDTWEAAYPGEHWKWGRSGLLWTVLLVRAFFSYSWLACLGFGIKDEHGICTEMRDRKEASMAERAARLRRKAEERKLAKIEKELEEEEERLQREEVARLVEEQRQARLREMQRQQGEERQEEKRGEGKCRPQPGGRIKKRGEKEHVQEATAKQEKKADQQMKEVHLNKAHGHTGFGHLNKFSQLHQQGPAAGKANHHGTFHAQPAGIPKGQQQQPGGPGKTQQQHNAASAKPAERHQSICTWKSVVAGSKKGVLDSTEATRHLAPSDVSNVRAPRSPKREALPAKHLQEPSHAETFTTPPCVSPVQPLSPPAPSSPRQHVQECAPSPKLPAPQDPLLDHRAFHSPSPPPVQQGFVPPLVSSPLRPQEDAKVQRPSPCLGAIGQGAIGQSPLRGSSSGEGVNQGNPVQRGLNFDSTAGARVESPQSLGSNWDIWDSLQLDSLVDSIHQEPGRGSKLPEAIPGSIPAAHLSSWPQGQFSPVWSPAPALPQSGTGLGPFPQQQQAPEVNPMWSYGGGFGQDFLWQGQGFTPGLPLDQPSQEHMGKGSIIQPGLFQTDCFGLADQPPASKADGLYVAPPKTLPAAAVHDSVRTPSWAAPVVDGLDAGVPPEFVDCITQEVMVDPVITADGHSYERSSIQAWLRNHDTSPLTGQVLPKVAATPGEVVDKTLRPNLALRSQIMEFRERMTRGLKNHGGTEGQSVCPSSLLA